MVARGLSTSKGNGLSPLYCLVTYLAYIQKISLEKKEEKRKKEEKGKGKKRPAWVQLVMSREINKGISPNQLDRASARHTEPR